MKNRFPLVMKTTAAITTLLTVILVLVYCFRQYSWIPAAAISCGTTAYHFLMRLAVGYLVPFLTHYDFHYQSRWFHPRKWEAALYKALKLRKWKGHLPTYAPGQFSLENQSLHRVIQNMCGAEVVHEIIMVFSFLPLLTIPLFGKPAVFLITSLLAALFDSLFVMAQRFNRPRLVRIHEKQEAKRP